VISGEVPPPSVARLIGFHLVAVEAGRAPFALDADERHHNPMGTLHGGILCDIADVAMGVAYASTLAEDESFTTLDRPHGMLGDRRTRPSDRQATSTCLTPPASRQKAADREHRGRAYVVPQLREEAAGRR
jgi:hypothetical protein